jgi:phage protein D
MKSYLISFDGEPADADLAASMQLVEVDERAAAPGTFCLTLRVELDSNGNWTFLDDDRFSLFTPVSIEIGNGDLPVTEPVMDGYLTSVALRVGAQPGSGYLDLRGMDSMVLLSVEEKTIAWANMADSDIASQILDSYDLSADTTATEPVRQDTDVVVVQRGTDAAFLRLLARRNGFEVSFGRSGLGGEGGCYFGPPRLTGTPLPDLAVRFGDNSNLRSFALGLDGLRPLAVASSQIDPKTKEITSADVTDSELDQLGDEDLGGIITRRLGQVVTPAEEQGRLLLLAEPSADDTVLTAAAQAVRDEASWAVTARGEVNTDAFPGVLRSGRVANVKGVGQQHSGSYYITRVTHRLTSDGKYSLVFEARRNALDGGGGGVSLP